jgi:hypothetical protein
MGLSPGWAIRTEGRVLRSGDLAGQAGTGNAGHLRRLTGSLPDRDCQSPMFSAYAVIELEHSACLVSASVCD